MLRTFSLIAFLSAAVFAAALISLMIGYSWQSSSQETNQQYSAEDKAKQNNRESEKPFWQKATSDPIAAFTLWLVIFTAVLGAASVFQLASLNRSEVTSAQAAQAAKDAADVAKSNLLVAQRAYVFVTFTQAIVKDIDGRRVLGWNFTPIWNNSAPTPTRNMRNHISLKVFDGAIPEAWDFPDRWGKETKIEDRKQILLPLGPRSILSGQTLFVNIDEIHEIVAGKKSLYIWGWAKYNDVFFPDTPDHVTRFANRIVLGGDPTNPERCSVSHPLHTKYNCSDEECSRQGYPAEWSARETDE
jgi:uncharacterized protein YpmB